MQSSVLRLCLSQIILGSLWRQYPTVLHQITEPGPKLDFQLFLHALLRASQVFYKGRCRGNAGLGR